MRYCLISFKKNFAFGVFSDWTEINAVSDEVAIKQANSVMLAYTREAVLQRYREDGTSDVDAVAYWDKRYQEAPSKEIIGRVK